MRLLHNDVKKHCRKLNSDQLKSIQNQSLFSLENHLKQYGQYRNVVSLVVNFCESHLSHYFIRVGSVDSPLNKKTLTRELPKISFIFQFWMSSGEERKEKRPIIVNWIIANYRNRIMRLGRRGTTYATVPELGPTALIIVCNWGTAVVISWSIIEIFEIVCFNRSGSKIGGVWGRVWDLCVP